MLAGCFVAKTPPNAEIACSSDVDCPADSRCAEAIGRCVLAFAPDPDVVDPTVLSVTFEPARVVPGGRVTAIVRASEPLRADNAALLFESSTPVPPVFSFTQVDDTEAHFDATIDAASPDITLIVRSVTLTDLAGNVAEAAASAALVVDGTAPRIVSCGLDDGFVDGVVAAFADVGAAAQLTACARIEEEASLTASLTLGELVIPVAASACTGTANSGLVCAVDGKGVLAPGMVLSWTAVDLAGNVGTLVTPLDVDIEPPAVTPGSSRVLRNGVVAGDVAVLPGDQVAIEFVASEPLFCAGCEVSAVLDEPRNTPLTVSVVGQQVSLALTVVDTPAPAAARVDGAVVDVIVTWADVYGHIGNVRLTGPRFAAAAVTPCTPVDNAARCVDLDADGSFGRSVGCVIERFDCDDTDPRVHPNSSGVADVHDVPENGIDEDCSGSDAALNDDDYVFVADIGCGLVTGTQQDPFRNLAEAVARAPGKAIVTVDDDIAWPALVRLNVDLFGGFDAAAVAARCTGAPAVWTRIGSARTTFVGGNMIVDGDVRIDHAALDIDAACPITVDTTAALEMSDSVMVRGSLCGFVGSAITIASTTTREVDTFGSLRVLAGSSTELIRATRSGFVTIDRATVGDGRQGLLIGDSGALVVTNTLVRGSSLLPNQRTGIVAFSRLVSVDNAALELSRGSHIIVGSIIDTAAALRGILADGQNALDLELRGNAFTSTLIDTPLQINGIVFATADAINVTETGLSGATDLVGASNVDATAANATLVGRDRVALALFDVPDAALADADFRCRPALADIGQRELD